MRKLVSICLLVALLSISLGATGMPASAAALNPQLNLSTNQAGISYTGGVTKEVWPVVFSHANSGSAGWADFGRSSLSSVEINLPEVFDQAEAKLGISPVTLGDIDAGNPAQANFYGYLNPANDSQDPASLYLNLGCDLDNDGTADYGLKTEVTAESDANQKWALFSPSNPAWQISAQSNIHGFSDNTSRTWDELKAAGFSVDKIISVSIYAIRDTGKSALSLNIDDITLGVTVYDLGQIQDAIDAASSGDTINVHPGLYPEFLNLEKSLMVKSSDGAEVTIIQPTTIPVIAGINSDNVTREFGQVVLISASDVVFQGFSVIINGYLDEAQSIPDTGIIAINELTANPGSEAAVSNVTIKNNIININNIADAWAIETAGYAGVTDIEGNTIEIGKPVSESGTDVLVSDASGIEVHNCDIVNLTGNSVGLNLLGILASGIWAADSNRVSASRNTVIIKIENPDILQEGGGVEGLYFERVPLLQANSNNVTLTGIANQAYMEGIGLWDYQTDNFSFDRATFNQNKITLDYSNLPAGEVNSEEFLEAPVAELYGLWAEKGSQVQASKNTIRISAVSAGQAHIEGLTCFKIGSSTSQTQNDISIDAQVSDRAAPKAALFTSSRHPAEVSAAAEKKYYFSFPDMLFNTAGQVYGIRNAASYSPITDDNSVDIKLDVETKPVESAQDVEIPSGLAYTMGLIILDNYAPQISNNHVAVTSNLVSKLDSAPVAQYIQANGLSLAIGVYLGADISIPDSSTPRAVISHNSIAAIANGQGGTNGTDVIIEDSQGYDPLQSAILDDLDSAIAEVIAQAGQVNQQSAPSVQSTDSRVQFRVVGIGIVAFNAPNLKVEENDPVTGMVTGEVTSASLDNYTLEIEAVAQGIAYGLGGGILVIQCDKAAITNNGLGESETLDADADITAVRPPTYGVNGLDVLNTSIVPSIPEMIQTSLSAGGSISNSFGILVVKDPDIASTTPLSVTITGNQATAVSAAECIVIGLLNTQDNVVVSSGVSEGYSLGIAALVEKAVIQGNQVKINERSTMLSGSLSDPSHNAAALGANLHSAVGIFMRGGEANQILDNTVTVINRSVVESVAMTAPLFLETTAIGLDRSVGLGLAVIGSGNQTIRGNQCTVNGTTQVFIISSSSQPLDDVELLGQVLNFNTGLLLVNNQNAQTVSIMDNVTQNRFAAGGVIVNEAMWAGDYTRLRHSSLNFSADAVISNSHSNFNYNDLVGSPGPLAAENEITNTRLDCGLFNAGSQVNARYNYWDDPSGPSGMGQGFGKTLVQVNQVAETPYSWWLSHPQGDLQEEHSGYYGFSQPLQAGWNTLSVPMSLEKSRWSDIVAMSHLDYEIAYYYDPTLAYPWVELPVDNITTTNVNESFVLKPLDGLYIKMKTAGTVFLTTGSAMGLPVRELTKGQSWYLVGVTPYDDFYPYTSEMPVVDAFYTLIWTPDGQQGMTGVVSPTIGGQEPWYWTTLSMTEYKVKQGKAYWVFMKNPGALYGFISTPLPAVLPNLDPN